MQNWPPVTVVMPVRNEAAFITRSLGAVLSQDYPHEQLEILVADGLSDDTTRSIIQQMEGAERVRILSNPGRIQAAGLNVAIREAKGDYIVRVDGHTIIATDYVRQCITALQATGAWNVGGAMDPIGITPMGKAIAAAGKSAFAVPSTFHVSNEPAYTDTVYLGAWPRSVFDQVSGYSEQVGVNEDYELNYRIRASGGRVFFSPDIRSAYYGRQTLGALARQYFRYGVSKVATLRLHPGSLRVRQLIAPLFVAGLVVGPLTGLIHPLFLGLYALALIVYVVLNLIFSVRAALREGWALVWRLPFVFLAIHLAWGAGFWVAILRTF